MRICIIGSGIAGLASAHYLADQPGTRLTILEAAADLGGRARVTDGVEHCTRFFMDDYRYVFDILRNVPSGTGSVVDSMRPVRRFAWAPSGRWVEITHVYASRARELSLRERWEISKANSMSLLVAKRSAHSSNVFGAGANYSLRSVLAIVRSINKSKSAFVLPGRTDELLVDPWVQHLVDRGVVVRTRSRVERLDPDEAGVDVVVAGGRERYDLAIVAAFVHDTYELLDRSGIPRPLDWRRHAHCKCFTIELDPREPVLDDRTQRSFTSTGLMLVLQPDLARCIALTTTLEFTDEESVLRLVSDRLPLRFSPVRVRARDNLDPADGVFAGAYVEPVTLDGAVAEVTGGKRPRVYFAGSYTANSYAVDSAEGACRSALHAVERIAASHPDDSRAWTLPKRGGPGALPVARVRWSRTGRTRPPAHPNALRRPCLTALAWHLARYLGGCTVGLAARVAVLDLSGISWPRPDPIVFVADPRNGFDAFAALLAFRRLRVRPRIVVAEHWFDGYRGRALDSIGALPAIADSNATHNAVVAAVRSGESVAFGLGEAPMNACDVAAATGAPIVPMLFPQASARPIGAKRLPRPGRSRLNVAVAIGSPVVAGDGLGTGELRALVARHIGELSSAVRAHGGVGALA